jgi:hypothetical protein
MEVKNMFGNRSIFSTGSMFFQFLFKHDFLIWLVVSTPLKNISQWEGLSHILWKIKMFQTTNQSWQTQIHWFHSHLLHRSEKGGQVSP